ncbi:MAG: DUF1667 domain-containing protein [Myxococcota bacterium]|jgi:CxxC motif-containing protein|nr:DUF1667 domain-containing protein [Myxococcota bacterium]
MSDTTTLLCISCPIGCPLQLVHEGQEIKEVTGAQCNRGAKYARQEFSDPRRQLSTTVPISGARWQRLPVRLSAPIPKHLVFEAVRIIHSLRLEAPVQRGQVLLHDLLGEGVDVLATRHLDRL